MLISCRNDTRTPQVLYALALLAIVGAPFTWFPPNLVIDRSDYALPLNPSYVLSTLVHAWDWSNLGSDNSRFLPMIPFVATWAGLFRAGVPIGAIEQLTFAGIFVLGIGGTRALLQVLGIFARSLHLLLVVTLLYGIYGALSLTVGHINLIAAYAAVPWAIASCVQLVSAERWWRPLTTLVLLNVLIAPCFTNPPGIISILVIPTLTFSIVTLSSRSIPASRVAIRVGLATIVLLLLNAWWLPALLHLLFAPGSAQVIIPPSLRLNWPNFDNAVDFWQFLRGAGDWGLYASLRGVRYFPNAAYFDAAPVIIASFLIPALALASLRVAQPEFKRLIRAAIIVVAAGVFLAKANNPPLSALSDAIYSHVPGMWIFRSTYEKFMPMANLALIVLYAVAFARARRARMVALLAAIVVAYPAITASLIANPAMNVSRATIPPEGYNRLFHENVAPNGAMLILPNGGYAKYEWGSMGGSVDFSYVSHERRVAFDPQGSGNAAAVSMAAIAFAKGPTALRGFAVLAGIGSVFVHRDIDRNSLGLPAYEDDLSSAASFSPTRTIAFDVGTLFLLKDSPRVFSTDGAAPAPDDTESLLAEAAKGTPLFLPASITTARPVETTTVRHRMCRVARDPVGVRISSFGSDSTATSISAAPDVPMALGDQLLPFGRAASIVGCGSGENELIRFAQPVAVEHSSSAVDASACAGFPCLLSFGVHEANTGHVTISGVATDPAYDRLAVRTDRISRIYILLQSSKAKVSLSGGTLVDVDARSPIVFRRLSEPMGPPAAAAVRIVPDLHHPHLDGPLVPWDEANLSASSLTIPSGMTSLSLEINGIPRDQRYRLTFNYTADADFRLIVHDPSTDSDIVSREYAPSQTDTHSSIDFDERNGEGAILDVIIQPTLTKTLGALHIAPVLTAREFDEVRKVYTIQRGGHIISWNPTRVEVQAQPSAKYLVALTSFDRNWNAYRMTPQGPVLVGAHLLANGFANAWRIDGGGRYVIEYRPQRIVVAGAIVSSIVALVAITMFVVSYFDAIRRGIQRWMKWIATSWLTIRDDRWTLFAIVITAILVFARGPLGAAIAAAVFVVARRFDLTTRSMLSAAALIATGIVAPFSWAAGNLVGDVAIALLLAVALAPFRLNAER